MSQNALTKLWSFFSFALLSTSFLFFLRTTGAGPTSGAFGFLGFTSITVPAVALPFDLVLLALTLVLTWVWSTQVGGPSWAHRLPIFYFERKDVDPNTLGGRTYQGLAVLLVLFIPMIFVAQMTVRYFEGTVVRTHGSDVVQVVKKWSEHFDASRLMDEANRSGVLKFGDPSGPEYLWWTPWLYSLLLLVVLVFWGLTIWSIFFRAHENQVQMRNDGL